MCERVGVCVKEGEKARIEYYDKATTMHYFAGHLQHDMFWVLLSIPLLCLQAVEESLKSLNLFHGGVSDKQAGKYSGGMKRRLSVAISLIGDPKVCLNFYFTLLCCLFHFGIYLMLFMM